MADTTPSKTNTEASIVTAAPQGSISTNATDLPSVLVQFNKLKQLFFQHMHKGTDKTKVLPASGSKLYGGYVNGAGTAGANFPSGWTVAKTAGQPTGDYTVTHNLNTTKYTFNPSSAGFSFCTPTECALGANSFRVQTLNVGASPSVKDNDWQFQLLML